MSEMQVWLASVVEAQIKNLFEQSPSCEWGGILVGDSEVSGEKTIIKVYGAIQATYKESFLDEFRTTSKMWKEFYAERDLHYPGAKIIGWYNYSPAVSWEPTNQQFEVHRKFFEAPEQVLVFIDRNGDCHCYRKNENEKGFVPCNVITFEGSYHSRKVKSFEKQEKTNRSTVRQGLKKAGVFLLFFALCVFGIVYKDLTKPITNYQPEKPTSADENKIADKGMGNKAAKEQVAKKVYKPPVTGNTLPASSGISAAGGETGNKVRYYTVQKGDSLWMISEKFYGTGFAFYKILNSNNIYNPSHLYIGQRLIIPSDEAE